ncbi:hypothetical protein [Thermoactinomyces sp. DSM 45892]|uniref:hypothetical protein n=1 Tax=Thermoactinomyces sp. DSM 45892 TaxID=1882753 RepID=UPI00089D0959|nr:hypothetical protein [Thermoactinomyces sp. DSM 45892]SDZ37659.1 hypothetical protein SAMN05444416_1295 [Thermoactinomyces sp. DSM 45892]
MVFVDFKKILHIEGMEYIMKKFLVIMLSLVLLSGCSLFSDAVNVREIGKEVEKTISKYNENEQKYIKMSSLSTEIGSIMLSMQKTGLNQDSIKQMKDKHVEMNKLLTEYKAEIQKINEELPVNQKKVDKIKKEKLKKLGDTFLANFKALLDSRLKIIEITEKSLANEEEVLKSVESKKEFSRKLEDDMTKLEGEFLTLSNESLQKTSAYNKSWQEFVNEVKK